MTNDILQEAIQNFFNFAERKGFALVKVYHGAKNPVGNEWPKHSSKDRADWERWHAEGFNIGIHAGASRLIIFDLDSKHGGIEAVRKRFDDWCLANGMAPLPHHVETPSKGQHVLMLVPEGVDATAIASDFTGKIGLGVEILTGDRQSIAPGSFYKGDQANQKPSGHYTFNPDAAVYEAPQAVLDVCRPTPRKPREASDNVGTLDFEDCKRLYQWLGENDAIGGDDDWRTMGMVARLEFGDHGIELWEAAAQAKWSEPLDVNSEKRWPSFATVPTDRSVRMESIFKRAHDAGWKSSVRKSVESMFGGVAQLATAPPTAPAAPIGFPVPPLPAEPNKPEELPLIFFEEVRNRQRLSWLIKGFLAEGATSSVFAPPKRMKSTIVTDAFVHVAAGAKDWRGHKIKEAKGVCYFAFERAAQIQNGLDAYRIRDGLEKIPFAIVPRLVNMIDPGCVDLIKNAIERTQDRYGIEVGAAAFDTWNKGIAAGGGNEDKAEHQNIAAANLRRLIEHFPKLHCLTVGHTGKEVSKGERGSNATEGDRDSGFEIVGDNGKFALQVAYANALADGEVITTFEGELIEIDRDEDGEIVKAFIVSKNGVVVPIGKRASRSLTDNEDLALAALHEVLKTHGKRVPEMIGGKSVTLDEWLDQCMRTGAVTQDKNSWRDLGRRQTGLIAKGRIVVLDRRVRLADGNSGPAPVLTAMPTLPSNVIPLPPK
jgi:hypothetical protein